MTRLEEIDKELASLSCSDNGCVIRKPKGMGTNGGCHCVPLANQKLDIQQRAFLKKAFMLREEQVRLLEDMVNILLNGLKK